MQGPFSVSDLPGPVAQPVGFTPLLGANQHKAFIRRRPTEAKQLGGQIGLWHATRAAEVRSASGKDTGTVRFDEGDFTIVADLPKRVDWDQDRLAATVERIRAAGDDPAEYVDISFKVPERNYVAWPDPYPALAPARGAWATAQIYSPVRRSTWISRSWIALTSPATASRGYGLGATTAGRAGTSPRR